MNEVETGVCIFFSGAKGYGFIKRSSGPDLFCHFSAINMPGYRILKEGQKVSFTVVKGDKGFQAAEVTPLEDK
jgi:CspA family cold shock protein